MLMLNLNNKYFIGSVYAGMLCSLGDVTEPFHVNFFYVFLRERAGAGQNLVGAGLKNLVQFYVFSHFYELLTNVLFLHLFQS